ncbi:MAG: hypothetical protein JWP77_2729 [Polaromonas sp.]|jgi:hypothetical protein|nr:hypothetical protein [Polaromonas sp.]
MLLAVCRSLSLLSLAVSLLAASAHALEGPQGKVYLSVSGNITLKNAGERADFDMAMLAALPQHSFTTQTPWYKEPKKFTGPLLRDVLAAAGAQGKTLQAVALNNFKVEVPVGDAQQFQVIVARLMDDQPMAIRHKGPLFIIYPFDSDSALQSTRYYSRSAWQLRAIEVK